MQLPGSQATLESRSGRPWDVSHNIAGKYYCLEARWNSGSFFYFFNSGKCQTVDGMSQNFLGVNEFWMGFINRPHWNSLCGRSKMMCVPELQGDVSSRILTDVHSSFTIRLFRNTQCIFMKCPLTISLSYSCLKNLLESVLNVSSLSLPLIYLTSVSLFMAVWLHNTDI